VSNGVHLEVSVLLSNLLSGVIFLSQYVGLVRVAVSLLGASNGTHAIYTEKWTVSNLEIVLLLGCRRSSSFLTVVRERD